MITELFPRSRKTVTWEWKVVISSPFSFRVGMTLGQIELRKIDFFFPTLPAFTVYLISDVLVRLWDAADLCLWNIWGTLCLSHYCCYCSHQMLPPDSVIKIQWGPVVFSLDGLIHWCLLAPLIWWLGGGLVGRVIVPVVLSFRELN